MLSCGNVGVQGDVKIELVHQGRLRDQVMCFAWLHTAFVPASGELQLQRGEVDKAAKDKRHRHFDDAFALRLRFRRPVTGGEAEEEAAEARSPRGGWSPRLLSASSSMTSLAPAAMPMRRLSTRPGTFHVMAGNDGASRAMPVRAALHMPVRHGLARTNERACVCAPRRQQAGQPHQRARARLSAPHRAVLACGVADGASAARAGAAQRDGRTAPRARALRQWRAGDAQHGRCGAGRGGAGGGAHGVRQ